MNSQCRVSDLGHWRDRAGAGDHRDSEELNQRVIEAVINVQDTQTVRRR